MQVNFVLWITHSEKRWSRAKALSQPLCDSASGEAIFQRNPFGTFGICARRSLEVAVGNSQKFLEIRLRKGE